MGNEVKKMFIDGQWILAEGGKKRELINPADGSCSGIVTEGDERDARKAISAAKTAFTYGSQWREMSIYERAALLTKTAEIVEERAEAFAEAETANTGKLYKETEGDVYGAAAIFRYFAGIIGTPSGQSFNYNEDSMTITLYEPMGVCGIIVPWNYPISIAAMGIAPALAAGCTVVVKPASITPLTAILLFEAMEEAGFPKGAVNLVLGEGAAAGKAIAESEDVDKVVFTGGTETGREILHMSASNIKSTELELGGKSPVILFDDCDLDAAVDQVLYAIFLSQGQVCTAGSRLILQDTVYDEVVGMLAERAQRIKLGAGKDPEAEMGPVIGKAHMERILHYIDIGIREGARLVCGGVRATDGDLAKGCFIRPTIFADVTNDMQIAQEEIFGPVLSILKFTTEEEAICLANGTPYGLAGAVFTKDLARAMTVVKRLKAGNIWVNTYYEGLMDAPAGGLKQSGLGSVMGIAGLKGFMDCKQVSLRFSSQKAGWFS